MAVRRAREIDDLASKLQLPTLDPNILATLLQTDDSYSSLSHFALTYSKNYGQQ